MRTLILCKFKRYYTHRITANRILQLLHAVGHFPSLILTSANKFAESECSKYVTVRNSLSVKTCSLVYPLSVVAELL